MHHTVSNVLLPSTEKNAASNMEAKFTFFFALLCVVADTISVIAFQAVVLLAKGAMSTHSPSRSLHSEFSLKTPKHM